MIENNSATQPHKEKVGWPSSSVDRIITELIPPSLMSTQLLLFSSAPNQVVTFLFAGTSRIWLTPNTQIPTDGWQMLDTKEQNFLGCQIYRLMKCKKEIESLSCGLIIFYHYTPESNTELWITKQVRRVPTEFWSGFPLSFSVVFWLLLPAHAKIVGEHCRGRRMSCVQPKINCSYISLLCIIFSSMRWDGCRIKSEH